VIIPWIRKTATLFIDDFPGHKPPFLVRGLEHVSFHILGIVTPTDSYISEGLKPPTR
jgi:hypothetical protein